MANPDPTLLSTFKPTAQTRIPRAAEPLWTLRKDGRRIDSELMGHGEYGWEFRLLKDGDFYAGRRFALKADANAHADIIRGDLERDGWLTTACRDA